MSGAQVLKSILPKTNFKGAVLKKASFKGSVLHDCVFIDADLSGCDMRQVMAQGAVFDGARTDDVEFYGKKPWSGESDNRDWSNDIAQFDGD